MTPVIKVEGLGKRYRIGDSVPYRTLREGLVNAVGAPYRLMREVMQHRGSESHRSKSQIWALRDVSFEVMPGEVLGVIGRNGAGKSTLLKILSRITEPTEGRAELHGRVGSLLEVGTGFHGELTGRENIYLSGAILGMRHAEVTRRFDEIVDFAGVDRFVDTPIKHFSSGMYMRLAFAVAAHLETEILLVDEVLAVGDIAFQSKCLEKIAVLARGGRTVVVVSHNMPTVHRMCQRAVLLDGGEVQAIGRAAEVIQKYQEAVTPPVFSKMPARAVHLSGLRLLGSGTHGSFTPDGPLEALVFLETDRGLPKCYVNLHIDDADGRAAIHLRTDFNGLFPSFEPGEHRVTVRVPRLSLGGGLYTARSRLYALLENEELIVDSESVVLEVAAEERSGLVNVPCCWSWTAVNH